MRKTDWFSADVKPVHKGIYEVERFRLDGSAMVLHRLRWNGKGWEYPSKSIGPIGAWACMRARDGDKWRGLTKPATTDRQ